MSPISILERATSFGNRPAIVSHEGLHGYSDILAHSARLGHVLLDGAHDLQEQRIGFLTHPGADYVVAQWAIWRAGGIAVPLATMYPERELEFIVRDSDAAAIVADTDFTAVASTLCNQHGLRFVSVEQRGDMPQPIDWPQVGPDRRAMIVYTSGSTGNPKGVVTTHANITAQIESLVRAWEWVQEDRILLALPLHHVHGIINVLACALWSGATCIALRKFDAAAVWRSFERDALTLFMGVPTIYRRLIDHWNDLAAQEQQDLASSGRSLRLMVSGSAALPVRTLHAWRAITGHTLLERYGMTETGMILSNPLHGERRPGFVGTPLPGVEVKLVDEHGVPCGADAPGELLVRGPGVFREYWRRPAETSDAFEGDWFKTGDVAELHDGSYRILGRRSVDIIKTGGYKVSALEIEEVLRRHPAIAECAVIGIPDDQWGERIAVVVEATEALTVDALQLWSQERLAPYKIPRLLKVVSTLPRNAMGKVVKPELSSLFSSQP